MPSRAMPRPPPTPPHTAKAQKSATKKTDRKLGLDVRKALSKAQGFDVSNVFVRARGGAVTLTGTVPDGSQIGQAEEVAKGVRGRQVRIEQDHARRARRRGLTSRGASSCTARRRRGSRPDGFRRFARRNPFLFGGGLRRGCLCAQDDSV